MIHGAGNCIDSSLSPWVLRSVSPHTDPCRQRGKQTIRCVLRFLPSRGCQSRHICNDSYCCRLATDVPPTAVGPQEAAWRKGLDQVVVYPPPPHLFICCDLLSWESVLPREAIVQTKPVKSVACFPADSWLPPHQVSICLLPWDPHCFSLGK